ncbi:glycosyltransferase family 4 protein [Roseovarius arcticus]|uniref:glycosyltransferase family 4 protein n=1 Tax=Roseovarius arcticus TaxID=2547404 RepID=UPI001486A2C3|nr:glycosyltransferase family 1 protein [Roseovarius arcticus]
MIPFASFVSDRVPPSAAESEALEAICKQYGADVFASTYYSTCAGTPSVQLVYDMIAEVMAYDLIHRDWQEKDIAMLYGRAHICISHQTRDDLLRFYPEISPDRVTVAHCGIETDVFRPRPAAEVDMFRRVHDLSGSYLMVVGARMHEGGYKNGAHLVEALSGMAPRKDLTVLFVGGEQEIPKIRMGGRKVEARRVVLSDDDLARAYCGAEALVYPSLYEGFGMPVAEAMACGCPVITTNLGSLAEVAGDAALLVSGTDIDEMRTALCAVREPEVRARALVAGPERARAFRWDAMADHVADRIEQLAEETRAGQHRAFLSEWAELRHLQSEVDF